MIVMCGYISQSFVLSYPVEPTMLCFWFHVMSGALHPFLPFFYPPPTPTSYPTHTQTSVFVIREDSLAAAGVFG